MLLLNPFLALVDVCHGKGGLKECCTRTALNTKLGPGYMNLDISPRTGEMALEQ